MKKISFLANKSDSKENKPSEGKPFKVNPTSIDANLFKKKRVDEKQERVRLLIVEALDVVANNSKYSKTFYTLIPEKKWKFMSIKKFKKQAYDLGGHIADWIEQALEWAQRICNGESWEDVCNKIDTAKWFRLIVWKNGRLVRVGGARRCFSLRSSADVQESYIVGLYPYNVVPLVACYK